MKTFFRPIAMFILLCCLTMCACAGKGAFRPTMRALFFPSAACLFFPDGGLMIIDIGTGISPALIAALRRHIFGNEIVYRVLAAAGWRPRIDWLIVAPRGGQWDDRFVDALMSFDIRGLYFPFDVQKNKMILGQGSMRLLFQVSMSGYKVMDLSRDTLDIAQSASKVKYVQLLPQAAQTDADAAEKSALCLLIEYGRVRVLIAGDLSARQQEALMAVPSRLQADVFFHPGSLSPAFCAAVGAAHDIRFDGQPALMTTDGSTVEMKEE